MARPSVLALLAAVPVAALVGCSSDDRPVVSVSDPRDASPTATATASATAATASPRATEQAAPSPAPAAPAGSPTAASASPARPVDPLSPVPAQESAAPVGQPPCRPADLTVVDADTLVLPETVHEVFVLRTSGPDCQLEGYPAVRLLDASGAPLRIAVTQGGQDLPATAPVPVTLSRSTSLSFVVATPRDGTCTDASAVDVVLPGTRTALRAATTLSVCGSAGVSPVERRTDDE